MDQISKYFTQDPPNSTTNPAGHVSSSFQSRTTNNNAHLNTKISMQTNMLNKSSTLSNIKPNS